MALFDLQLPNLLRRRSNSVVGMDIGTDAVRLALVERSGDSSIVRWVEEVSLTALQGFADYESIEELLSRVLEHRVDGQVDVATPPPWSSARIAVQEFPAMDPARFQKAAHWHFQRNRSEDMDRPLNCAIPQGTRLSEGGKEHMDGIMVSMDAVMLDGLEHLCSSLRIRLRAVLPQPACYVPLLSDRYGAEHASLNVDIGAGQTRVTMVVGQNVRLVRKIKPCANDVVRHICDSAGLSWEDANHALLAHSGLGPLAEEDPEGIAARARDPIETALDRLGHLLAGEIERSIAYIEARHPETVQRIVLSGGLAGSPYLVRELGAAVSHPVEVLSVLSDMQGQIEVPANARVHYDLAIGVAVLALRDGARFDILDSQETGSGTGSTFALGPLRKSSRLAVSSAVVGLLLAGVGYDVHRHRQNGDLSRRIDRAQTRLEQLSAQADSLANQRNLFALADRIEELRSIYDDRRLYTPFLSRLVSRLPEGIWLSQLQLQEREMEVRVENEDSEVAPPPKKTHHLRVVGHSHVVESVGEFVLTLERERLLREIQVLNIREVDDDARPSRFRFEIEGEPIVPSRVQTGHEFEEVAR